MPYDDEVLKLFIGGLEPTIRKLVARHRESHSRSTYLEIVRYARGDGDPVRAHSHTANPTAHNPSWIILFNLIRSSSDSSLPSDNGKLETTKDVHLIQEIEWQQDSQYSLVPSTSDSDNVLDLQNSGYRFVQPPTTAHASPQVKNNRPRLVERPARGIPHGMNNQNRPELNLIWHECYELNHISPDCILSVRDQIKFTID